MAKTKKIRKGPATSATKFSVGTKKKGNDGNIWIVILTSSGIHRWKKISKTEKKEQISKNINLKDENNDKVLFVFYTFDNTDSWSYGKLPKGWRWAGSGSTSAMGKIKVKYEQEEQFMGPEKTIKQMHNFLNNYFTNLKKKGTIKIYKIAKSYSP